MGHYYSDLTKEEKEAIDKLLSLQAYLNYKADIKYQCYYLKIDEEMFWEIYLWRHKSINQEIVFRLYGKEMFKDSSKK